MTFCECGKRTMMIRSSGLWLKVNGTQATEGKREIGNEQ